MRTTKTIMVEKKITTCKCDFCESTTQNNSGCCGVAPIMYCTICEKDMCHRHRKFYTEDEWEDYPYGFYACPDCQPTAGMNWMWLQENAGRLDDIVEEAIEATRKGIRLWDEELVDEEGPDHV